jgi:hypothetical protein
VVSLDENDALVKFWLAMLKADEKDSEVALPAGVFNLGQQKHRAGIFVRPCYPKLLRLILAAYAGIVLDTKGDPAKDEKGDAKKQPPLTAFTILGNPGIGKSHFALYLLRQYGQQGKTVVFESVHLKDDVYCFGPDGSVLKGSRDRFKSYLDATDGTSVYLVDARAPDTTAQCLTILVTTPKYVARLLTLSMNDLVFLPCVLRVEIWKQFQNSNASVHAFFYLPVFNFAEITAVHRLQFRDLTEDAVKSAYGKFGGLARCVLDCNTDTSELEDKVASADLDLVVRAVGSSQAHETVSHKILHFKVDGTTFKKQRLEFGSAYIARRCVDIFNKRNRDAARTWITSS